MSELDTLIQLLAKLPGLGPRSARRAALFLIKRREHVMEPLAVAMSAAAVAVRPCSQCGNLDTAEPCAICRDPERDAGAICVVEDLADLWALERTGAFRGRYHALGGKISPLDHVAPEDLRIKELVDRIDREKISEIIFALAADVEGEATTNYIVDLLKSKPVALTRIARGIPAGGGLESADELTLSAALSGRTKL